jgi:DNA-binding transcriptional LysR family regulator
LSAVRETGKKTHIIGLANLNPTSFQPYLNFCLALQLVEDSATGYRLTPRAEAVLEVIQRLLARSADVDAALLDLHRDFSSSSTSRLGSKGTLRYVSIMAWDEVVRSALESGATEAELANHRRSVVLPTATTPVWLNRVEETEAEGSVAARDPPWIGESAARRRPARSRPRE